ncbi:TetR/AcrR family transcriptional regulator [Virgibacillus sp. W0181]|uniref:TetR/AcrR family transcriptional regulator n=1 Tax=Virgibacillus sp. W0181 TaxID=3391581 RepID=UPI003F4737D0
MDQNKIFSNIKNTELVEKRRKQMIKGAITLFKQKGFHRTTTREIANEAGFSIGTLYEYIRTKEDILFLVCDSIYDQVTERMEKTIDFQNPSLESLATVIELYFRLMDEIQDEVIIMYQEVKSLKDKDLRYILDKERDMVSMLKWVIVTCVPHELKAIDAELLANNMFVQGQMWAFRRWTLQKQFNLETYIAKQTEFFLQAVAVQGNVDTKEETNDR